MRHMYTTDPKQAQKLCAEFRAAGYQALAKEMPLGGLFRIEYWGWAQIEKFA